MLEKAKDRRCYNKLIKADITKPLAFPESSLDYLICVGTSTYLGNSNNKNSIQVSSFWNGYFNTQQNETKIYFIATINSILDTSVLVDWLKILKKDGILCVTHKSQVWTEWENVQEDIVNGGRLRKIWKSSDLFYLPSCEGEDISTRVRIYIFSKC